MHLINDHLTARVFSATGEVMQMYF